VDGVDYVLRAPGGEQIVSQMRFAQKSRQIRKHLQVPVNVWSEEQKEKADGSPVGCAVVDACWMSSKNDERLSGGGNNGISRVRNGNTTPDCGAGKLLTLNEGLVKLVFQLLIACNGRDLIDQFMQYAVAVGGMKIQQDARWSEELI
jgi:hypothetical protein